MRREGSSRPRFLDLPWVDGGLLASGAVVPGPGSRNAAAWEGRSHDGGETGPGKGRQGIREMGSMSCRRTWAERGEGRDKFRRDGAEGDGGRKEEKSTQGKGALCPLLSPLCQSVVPFPFPPVLLPVSLPPGCFCLLLSLSILIIPPSRCLCAHLCRCPPNSTCRGPSASLSPSSCPVCVSLSHVCTHSHAPFLYAAPAAAERIIEQATLPFILC